ncbi:hypothetical protein MJO28_011532 [Puccinia striiformis f. sp. tritici]|uniref:Uncharacterized protein n=2 Tax=Puccinia striiformis f. sp. tritici TaxID=168172 RepID=A0A0L0VPN1_9BASI|nr:hypothetical protein Pst134EA_021143 [Puccinia striiformis f. sp. tritici]KAI9614838.1 hypothetical protein H4Q26_009234 [Puccinia striiformis f. sp. tritici PST-130]KNF01162.1 hypothetical protein PSTG_05516 [Puccinia striiformis f. sp. tritici PST-78]KAH9457258.1 hypothetical protein Pst134EA_021143 [Puccinia striiformis f. sp. tritici]KAI7944004.1 hypothetical protein MJO28_011532 [Puccinia striiformis f. sp. tritici]KAI7946776.1 hypothetical protein MJO29_011303 [Puccinia striiformis f.
MLFGTTHACETDPPNRNSRAQCWTARDGYFGCLAQHHHQKRIENSSSSSSSSDSSTRSHHGPSALKYYFVPGEEPSSVCSDERSNYHSSCMKSWVDHFNKRIVNEQRSVATQVGLSKSRLP